MQRRAVILPVLIMLIASLACSVPGGIIETLAPGGTWYVTTSGNDSNDCLSEATACLTVAAAVSKAAIAGVIEIGPGNFSVIDPRYLGRGLNLTNKVLTLRGSLTAGAPATTLDGGSADFTIWINGIHGSGIILFENLIIQGGGAGGSGAALWFSTDEPSGVGVSLRNVIIQGSSSYGIDTSGPVALQLDQVQVLNNRGMGIYMSGGIQLTINGSTISGNGGGGVVPGVENATITDTTISDNGTPMGAQVFNGAAQLRIERSTISGARAEADCHPDAAASCGMGIYNPHSLIIVNSTIAANSGMGITTNGDLKMVYSTVASNGDSGLNIVGGVVTLGQDIVENNSSRDCTLSGAAFTVHWYYVILSDGTCSPSIFILPSRGAPDPYLGLLANNGGPTQTMALTLGSAAINASTYGLPGPASYDPELESLPTDQRGMPRPGADGGPPDVGAYEYQGIGSVPAVPTPTASAAVLILDRNANCRNGPGTAYESVDAYPAGQSLQVDGRNEQAPWWWQVVIPNSKKHCWISSVAGTPPGDFTLLPVVPVAPAPDQGIADPDNDGDGYPASTDCNDSNGKIHPGAGETPDDKVDSNCNGDDDT